MRFFTDQFFTEAEKAQILGSKIPGRLGQQPTPLHKSIYESPAVSPSPHFNADTNEFEKTSKRVEFVFLGGILGFYAVAALLDMLARTHTLSI